MTVVLQADIIVELPVLEFAAIQNSMPQRNIDSPITLCRSVYIRNHNSASLFAFLLYRAYVHDRGLSHTGKLVRMNHA